MDDKYFHKKNVLIISPESWSHLFVSKHHYAIELSRNNNVYFLNPPTGKYAITTTQYVNLYQLDYVPFAKGLRFFPSVLQRYFMRSKFNKLQRIASVTFDCVWSFDNSVFFDFSFLPKTVLKISHIVDLSQNFQLSKAASTADICFGVSQNIIDLLAVANKNTVLIPHGISLSRNQIIEIALPGKNPVKALYAGKLDSQYLDKAVFDQLINEFSEVDFIFLGSGHEGWDKKNNTYFLGVINHEHLMSYLESADVLLIAYDVERFPGQRNNAHKILEYLYSGKVTISNFVSDYSDKTHLLEMAKTREEFPAVFKKVITNLTLYNNSEKVKMRKEYAAANTYSKRLEEIERLIGKTLDK